MREKYSGHFGNTHDILPFTEWGGGGGADGPRERLPTRPIFFYLPFAGFGVLSVS